MFFFCIAARQQTLVRGSGSRNTTATKPPTPPRKTPPQPKSILITKSPRTLNVTAKVCKLVLSFLLL